MASPYSRAVFALACSTLVACAASDTSETSQDADLVSEEQLRAQGFTLYVQAPLPMELGQAVEIDAEQNAKLLDKKCVDTGETRSTLQMMQEDLGSDGLGMTITGGWGLAATGPGFGSNLRDDTPGIFGMTTRKNADTFLPQVGAYVAAQVSAPTRESGEAGFFVSHNAFYPKGGMKRLASGPECGTHFVRTLEAQRFLSIAATLDFASTADRDAFRKAFGGVNAILESVFELDEVASFLREKKVKLGFHVLVSKEVSRYVKATLASDTCTIETLAGCRDAVDHLNEIVSDLGQLPGKDDTLEDMKAPNAGWGFYSFDPTENAVAAD